MKLLTGNQEIAVDLLKSLDECSTGLRHVIRKIKLHQGLTEEQANWQSLAGEQDVYKGLKEIAGNVAINNFI